MRRPQASRHRRSTAMSRRSKRGPHGAARERSQPKDVPMTHRVMPQRVTSARSTGERHGGVSSTDTQPFVLIEDPDQERSAFPLGHTRPTGTSALHFRVVVLRRAAVGAAGSPTKRETAIAKMHYAQGAALKECSSARCPRRGSSCGPPTRATCTGRSASRHRCSSGRRARWGPPRPRPRTPGAPCRWS